MDLELNTSRKMKEKNANNNLEKEQIKNAKIENKIRKNEKFKKNITNIANAALDIGIRMALPNYIEDVVIDVKNVIIENGFREGMNEITNKAKNLFNIVFKKKKDYSKVEEIRNLTKQNGILDSFSKLLGKSIDTGVQSKLISKEIGSALKVGKTAMVNTFSDKLEDNLFNEIKNIDKFNESYKRWEKCVERKDKEGMAKEYKKMLHHYNKISIDIKQLNNFEKIEYIQKYIQNNKNPVVSNDELELLKQLAK